MTYVNYMTYLYRLCAIIFICSCVELPRFQRYIAYLMIVLSLVICLTAELGLGLTFRCRRGKISHNCQSFSNSVNHC